MSDGELVGRVRRGDPGAFAELYRTHVTAVRTVVADRVHGAEAVADVVQEVFARALERLATLRESDHFRPWLLAIARHAAIDSLRIQARTRCMPDDDSCDRAAAEDGPDALAELAELSQLVNGLVAGLSRRDATALTLVTNFGFSPAEVADALGVSPGAAKVIVHRARRRLHDALTLELMVRRRGAGCATFAAFYDTGAMREAARHVRVCSACAASVSGDVELFGARNARAADEVSPSRL
ncbi:MAG: hypothetical protein QOE35_2292 [Actinomycetota bacterium]